MRHSRRGPGITQFSDQATGRTTGVRFPARAAICFLFVTASRPALGVVAQPPIEWIPGIKRPGRELTSHLPLMPMLRMRGVTAYNFTPLYVFMAWYLVKHSDSFASPVIWSSSNI
jgi:hypothetical protein